MLDKEFDLHGSDVSLEGIKIALVIDNNDPKAMERVLVRVVGVHDMNDTRLENSIWADRIAFSKFSSGDIPDVGDYLYVIFPDPSNPMSVLWMGWVRHMKR